MSFDWKIQHGQVISDFLSCLDAETKNYILQISEKIESTRRE